MESRKKYSDLSQAEFEYQMDRVDKNCRERGKIACWEDFQPHYFDENFNRHDVVNVTNSKVDNLLGCQGIPDVTKYYDYDTVEEAGNRHSDNPTER